MDRKSFQSWLDLYGKAWQTRNPELIKKLFTHDATYHEKPFDQPIRGIDAIADYWSIVSQTQRDVNFNYDILSVNEKQGIAHWAASFIRGSTRIQLDGVFVVELNSKNKCLRFREWWQSKKIDVS